MEFPKFGDFGKSEFLVVRQGSLLKREVKRMEKKSFIGNANDPSENMFRTMMGRVQGLDKEIKKLTSKNLKQTTFLDPNALKRKVNAEYPGKRLKRN